MREKYTPNSIMGKTAIEGRRARGSTSITCGTGGIIKGKLLHLLGKILIINRVGVFRALIPPSSTAKIKVPKITVKNHGPNQISIIKVGRDFIHRDVDGE